MPEKFPLNLNKFENKLNAELKLEELPEGAKIILSEIRDRTVKEMEKVIQETNKKYSEIVNEAKKKAEKIKEERKKKIVEELIGRENAKLARLRLQENRRYLLAREEETRRILERALAKISEKITQDREAYINLLTKWVEDSIKKLDTTEIILQMNKRDTEWMRKEGLKIVMEKMKETDPGISLEMGKPIETVGGFIAVSKNGSKRFINTLESKITAIKEDLINNILKIVFGEGEEYE